MRPHRGSRTERMGIRHGRSTALLSVVVAVALMSSTCTDGGPSVSAPEGSSKSSARSMDSIDQPIVEGLQVAPESDRVDITMPIFSDPTNITNPLFPVSKQHSVLLLGQVDGKAFRTEVTLLPDARIIEWEGQVVETLVSQYVAFLDGRIEEVAYDLYAQADDGSVWYFGEDVFNFKDGVIADTHGTWVAGRDGPAAMIMPADPQVGDVYRPENIPGFVFEEVTVKSVEETLDGPLGPVDGGLVIEELHMDGGTEKKTFGPGYGEFYTAGGGDVEALALAVPTDAISEPIPEDLTTLERGALDAFEAAGSKNWKSAPATVEEMTTAWNAYKQVGVPKRIGPRMDDALARLTKAVAERGSAPARQAAIDTAQWALDLQLRYRPPLEVDLARFDLWLGQLLVDAAAGDAAAVNGDFFTLDYIRDRILHALQGADATAINAQLEALHGAVGDEALDAAARAAARLRDTLAPLL